MPIYTNTPRTAFNVTPYSIRTDSNIPIICVWLCAQIFLQCVHSNLLYLQSSTQKAYRKKSNDKNYDIKQRNKGSIDAIYTFSTSYELELRHHGRCIASHFAGNDSHSDVASILSSAAAPFYWAAFLSHRMHLNIVEIDWNL